MTTADYREKLLPKLPQQPGVYKFINGEGEVIYVGKAKNLKNRVSNYFTSGKSRSYKTRTMVKNASHLEFIIVDNEHDALLLENTLIKKIQPRFNVVFRDDKSYTYICVKNARDPVKASNLKKSTMKRSSRSKTCYVEISGKSNGTLKRK